MRDIGVGVDYTGVDPAAVMVSGRVREHPRRLWCQLSRQFPAQQRDRDESRGIEFVDELQHREPIPQLPLPIGQLARTWTLDSADANVCLMGTRRVTLN